MKKDNLVVIAGMPRAGTTYMYQTLKDHPMVFMPKIKEINFFSFNFNKGHKWYESLFSEANDNQIYFDISPQYFLHDDFFENVKNFNPNQKVILFLREPNEWIISFYRQVVRNRSFQDITYEMFISSHDIHFEGKKQTVCLKELDYISKVDEFIRRFKNNLLIINFDYFKANKVDVLQSIERFSRLNNYFTQENVDGKKVNSSNRDNNKLVAYLSTISLLRKIAFILLPMPLIDYIRNKYIIGSEKDEIIEDDSYPIYDSDKIFKKAFFEKKEIIFC